MASISTQIVSDFPSRAYGKYRSHSKTNPLMNKLNNDTGYPQQYFPHPPANVAKNYLSLNKCNLKNFFFDRLPRKEPQIVRSNQSIQPSRLFEMKKKQFDLKWETKTTLNETIEVKEEPFGCNIQKISQIFMVNDKTIDMKNKYVKGGQKNNHPHNDCDYQRGTKSFSHKYAKVAKKDAYQSVFGPDISMQPKQSHQFRTTFMETSKQIKRNTKTTDQRQRRRNGKKFSQLLHNMDQHRQAFDVNNNMNWSSYQIPKEQKDKKEEKTMMITWIKDTAKNYQHQSITNGQSHMKKLQDIDKIDPAFYQTMRNHKQKRLRVRSMMLGQKSTIKFEQDQSEVSIAQNLLNHIENQNEQTFSISTNKSRDSCSNQNDHVASEKNKTFKSVFDRFQQFGEILVMVLFQAKLMKIEKQNIYNAFWRNPQPYQMSGSYAFFKAIKKGDLEGVKKFLSASPQYIYERDHKGRSALIYAIANHHNQIVDFILTFDININQKCMRKRTALYYALSHEDPHLVQTLIKKGIQVWSTPECDLSQVLSKVRDTRVHNLIKNGRKLAIAMSLQSNRLKKLQFWESNKHLLRSDGLIKF